MKILHIAYEFPLPTIHGGRLDIWQHLCGFKSLKHSIFHISWSDKEISNENYYELKEKVEDLIIINKNKGVKHLFLKLLYIFRYPSLVYDRIISKQDYQEILTTVKEFDPTVIFLDVLYGGQLAIQLKEDLKIPLIVRSQNIEHIYIKQQLKNATTIKMKIALSAALFGLKKYEFNILKKANLVADISDSDLEFWKNNGINHIKWLPPIITAPPILPQIEKKTDYKYDVTFFGNLNAPNNVDGIIWFVNNILPILREKKDDMSVLLMGSNPSNEIINLISKNRFIELIPNVKNPAGYISLSKVLINPVRFGSGVKMKTIEMLFTDKQVVSTSEGIKGLPRHLFEQIFFIADTPEIFAKSILKLVLNNEEKLISDRTNLRDEFSISRLDNILLNN